MLQIHSQLAQEMGMDRNHIAIADNGSVIELTTKHMKCEASVPAGEVFVVRPSESVKVPSLCREPDELERIYQVGRHDAEATLPALEAYLAG